MKSLGAILALALAGLQLVAIAVVVFSSYVTSERSLLEHARSQLVDVGTNVIQHTEWFMSPARSAAELSTALATNRIVRREDRDHLEGLLFQQLRSAPQFAGAYYGDAEGNFVYVKREAQREFLTKIVDVDADHRAMFIRRADDFSEFGRYVDPTDTYDPRARPWYIEATDERGSIWTDPYIFFTSQSPGITAATPVVGFTGNVQGVVGVDIEIAELSNFLSNLRIGMTGAAFILNRNGDVIAHPNPDLLTTEGEGGSLQFPSITEIADPVAQAAFGDRLGPDGVTIDAPIQSDFEWMGERFVSLIMPFGLDDIPWTIVLYAPTADFTAALKANRTQNTLIAIAVAAITALLGLALANRIHAPVRAFAVRSSLISQGEVDPDEPLPSTYKELENANTALVHEISQRRKTETEYREIFERASRGMVRVDSKSGRLRRVNESFSQMLGYDSQDLEGVDFRMLLDPDETEVRAEFSDWIGAQQAFGFEAKLLDRNGDPVWVSFNGIYVHDGGPEDTYVVATIDDITQARATEETIETLNREIAHFSRQEMLGELATGLAHELNQPLTAITQNVDAAQLTLEKTPERKQDVQALLGEIEDHAHQAADIIRALRALVRKDENVPSDFGIVQLVTQARRLVLPEARAHGVEFVLPKGPEITVRAVKVQVAQVVVNLLRNAVESLANAEGGNRVVRITTDRQDDRVLVVVEDTGPGIVADLELFTPFETTKRDGMGLGLSISRTLIEANGGKIWHEGSDQVTRFCFTLPLRGIG